LFVIRECGVPDGEEEARNTGDANVAVLGFGYFVALEATALLLMARITRFQHR
jgi:hypothetical protein